MKKNNMIAEMHVKVNEMHNALMGNGQPGMIAEFNQAKGAIKLLKWVMGSGWLLTLIGLGASIFLNLK